jgi:capsular exopolysaccharide synthesis family protein
MDSLRQPTGESPASDVGTPLNRDLFQAFFEKAWLIVCIVAAAAAAGVWIGSRSPLVYQSRAVLFLDFGEQVVLNTIQEVDKREKGSPDLLNTIANNVKSSGILKRVVAEQKLVKHPLFNNGTNAFTEEQIVGMLRGAVDARLRRFTRLIDVTVDFGDPAMAQLVAQSVAEEYIRQSVEDRMGAGTNAGQFLMGEETRIKQRLQLAERAVQQYSQTNNISLQEGANILTDEFKALSDRCTEAKTERLLIEGDWRQAQLVGERVEQLLTLPSVARSPEVLGLKEKLQNQEAAVSNLELRYKDKHPTMIQARNELASVKKALEEEIRKAPLRLKQQREAAIEKEKSLEQALKEHEKKLGQLSFQRIEFDRLQREAASERRLYDEVFKRLREIDVTGGIKKNDVRIVEPAGPGYLIRPNKRMILIQAVALGLVLSVALVWLLQQLDTSIKSVDHAESLLGLPVLGAVPRNKLVKDGKGRLFISDDPQSLCAEAFRSMRASLALLGREEDRKVVFFTSAVPSEGKSFCCVNYAVAYAQQGKRTLVIDFDLRKPTLAESFGLADDLAGVSDVLLGKATLDQCVQKTRFENLFLLTAGRTVPNPAELLSGQWAKQLIREAAAKYDQVVLDNAPINAVSDALLIVNEAQTVCLVANARKTSYRVVQRALEMLRRAGAKPSGVVLNFLPQSAGSGYYYYYSGNKYYGKKGVYGASSSRG